MIVTRSHLHNSWAPALQIGFDYMIDRHWGFNVDVEKPGCARSGTVTATSAR